MDINKKLLNEYKINVQRQLTSASETILLARGALQAIDAMIAELDKTESKEETKSEVSNGS